MAIVDSRERARRRRREILIGITVMIAIMAAAVWFVLNRAGEWGVPGFGYVNEYGSLCENGLVSDTCTTLTIEEIGTRLGVPLPEGAEVLDGVVVTGANTTMDARVRIPAAEREALQARLVEAYGECRTDLPPPGLAEGMTEPCVMGNDQFASESMSTRYVLVLGVREGETDAVLGVDFLWR